MITLHELMDSLNHNSTRDLAWAIFSPDLLKHPSVTTLSPNLNQTRIDWLRILDKSPDVLEDDLYSGRSLGRYYESLWTYFFQHDKQYQLISLNLPVRENSKTIGEFDFIIKDINNDFFIHHEVAVKYYLFFQSHKSQTVNDKNNWLGPNSKDTLQKKWAHITQHQSQLSEHSCAKKELSNIGINKIKKTLAIKGYLFTPSDIGKSNKNAPTDFNNENNLSQWFTINNFLLAQNPNKTLAFIPKKRWLSTSHEPESIELFNKENLVEKIRSVNTPLMAAYVKKNGGLLSEEERFFIIPDSWPYSKL